MANFIIETDIMNITKGIIIHQVNCQNAIGAGISGVICKRYPSVKKNYHWLFKQKTKEEIFGCYQPCKITDDLIIVNSFTQFSYGNPKRTGKVYTDIDKLVNVIATVCDTYPDKEVYVSEFIGCGFGGANWDELLSRLQPLRVTIVQQPEYIKRTYRACK